MLITTVLLSLLLRCSQLTAQTLCPSGTMCYQVAVGANQTINVFGVCAIVYNNTASGDIHVPTNTETEWVKFLLAVNAGTVPGVSLGCCSNSYKYTTSGVTTTNSYNNTTDNTAGLGYTYSATTFTLPLGCTTMTVKAWGAGGGAGAKFNGGTSRYGGAGGAVVTALTSQTPKASYTASIGVGGKCNVTAGTGAYAGGGGGSVKNTAGSNGTDDATNGATKNQGGQTNAKGGDGYYGGGGGGGGKQDGDIGAGGGAGTSLKQGTTNVVIVGGGGGSGPADAGGGGYAGAGCGVNSINNGTNGGAKGSGYTTDGGSGGGGGDCYCIGTCTKYYSTSATSAAANAADSDYTSTYGAGGPVATGACSGTSFDGKDGYLVINVP